MKLLCIFLRKSLVNIIALEQKRIQSLKRKPNEFIQLIQFKIRQKIIGCNFYFTHQQEPTPKKQI